MKIAVCYHGMFRTFTKCIDNQIEKFLSKHDCDFYLDMYDVYGHGYVAHRYDFREDFVTEEDKNIILNKLNPIDCNFEKFSDVDKQFHEESKTLWTCCQPYSKNVLSMYYKIHRVIEMVKNSGKKYDAIVKIRPDIKFELDYKINSIEGNSIYITHNGGWTEDTIGDSFLYGDMESMYIYGDMYNNLKTIWDKVGPSQSPEFCLFNHLSVNNKLNLKKEEIYFDFIRDETAGDNKLYGNTYNKEIAPFLDNL
jgi:hypothetical protein